MLRQLFGTVNGKHQKSKKIATDSNYLRCHALLTALHFPLETTWSCKQDRKERYWGQQFWQMERDISVRPTEMTRPVTVDHLQSWSRIFRSDQTEMVRSIWCTNRNYRNFGLNGKRLSFPTSMSWYNYWYWTWLTHWRHLRHYDVICCSKHKLSTILTANVANLVRLSC